MIPTDLLADIERAQDIVRILRRDEPVGYDYYVNGGRIFSLTRALAVEARKNFLNDAELANVLDLLAGSAGLRAVLRRRRRADKP